MKTSPGSPSGAFVAHHAERGALHRRAGQPCQDHARSLSEGTLTILAVADGHGDPRHLHSDVGSALAVEVATEHLRAFVVGNLSEADAIFAGDVKHLVQPHLVRSICRAWNRAVLQSARDRGLVGEGPLDEAQVRALYTGHGTTLIAALFTPDTGVLLQIGDGDAVLVAPDGVAQRAFSEQEEVLFGAQTRSLCDPSASLLFRVRILDLHQEPLALALLATDGVGDSMASPDDLLRSARWFRELAQAGGRSAVEETLEKWLSDVSVRGVGDDASLALAWWPRPAIELESTTSFESEA